MQAILYAFVIYNFQVGVVLMDCQGLFDQNTNHDTIDAIVALCGLEMSKIHIVNLKGDINAADLSHLHV